MTEEREVALELNEKVYVGDGVYARLDYAGYIVLTTENGISVTNEVRLEQEVWESLVSFKARADELVQRLRFGSSAKLSAPSSERAFVLVDTEGCMNLKTLYPSEMGVMVNAIVSESGIMVSSDWSSNKILRVFNTLLGSKYKVAPVTVTLGSSS